MRVLTHLCFDQPPKLPGRIIVPSFTWEGSSWVRLPTQGFGDEEQASPKRFPARFLGKARAAPAGVLKSLEQDCVGLTAVTSRMLQGVEGLAFPSAHNPHPSLGHVGEECWTGHSTFVLESL